VFFYVRLPVWRKWLLLTRVVASGVSWAVGVTQRHASVTLPALGKLESAYNPCKEKTLPELWY